LRWHRTAVARRLLPHTLDLLRQHFRFAVGDPDGRVFTTDAVQDFRDVAGLGPM
jgi:hypothetical protein